MKIELRGMMTSLTDFKHLSISERIQLVEDIWDTIAIAPEELAVSEAQQQELDRRIEAYHQKPQAGASWQEVQTKIKVCMEA